MAPQRPHQTGLPRLLGLPHGGYKSRRCCLGQLWKRRESRVFAFWCGRHLQRVVILLLSANSDSAIERKHNRVVSLDGSRLKQYCRAEFLPLARADPCVHTSIIGPLPLLAWRATRDGLGGPVLRRRALPSSWRGRTVRAAPGAGTVISAVLPTLTTTRSAAGTRRAATGGTI